MAQMHEILVVTGTKVGASARQYAATDQATRSGCADGQRSGRCLPEQRGPPLCRIAQPDINMPLTVVFAVSLGFLPGSQGAGQAVAVPAA